MNQYLSMEGKVSLSRTKAEDRPYFGSYGVIAQLIGIPHNVSLDDLKNYSTENSAHVNWAGPNPDWKIHITYKTSAIILTNVGELSDTTTQKSTLPTGYTLAPNMHSTITVHVFKAPTYRTVSVKLSKTLPMTV